MSAAFDRLAAYYLTANGYQGDTPTDVDRTEARNQAAWTIHDLHNAGLTVECPKNPGTVRIVNGVATYV